MSTVEERVAITEVPTGGDELRCNWPWFVLLGVALTAVGFIALWSPWVASLATTVVIGSLLLVAGSAAWSAPGVTEVENDLIVSG